MNFAIRYLTSYEYDNEVVDNLNALRVKPVANDRQRCDEFGVRLTPEARLHRHADYFGTEVVEFEVSQPHRALRIDVRASVSTKAPPEPPQATWDALREPGYREAAGEFLFQTDEPSSSSGSALSDLVAVSRSAANPLAMLMLVSELVPDRFEYRQGATYVHSRLDDLLDGGAGVCQDFVHLGLYLLRRRGIAARYVSGYLFAAGDDGGGGATSVEVDTHAWLEALLPVPGGGEPVWVGADPTNRGLAGQFHVKIGHGRFYPDVPPIKGVYRGGARSTLSASVTMTRLDRVDPAAIARS